MAAGEFRCKQKHAKVNKHAKRIRKDFAQVAGFLQHIHEYKEAKRGVAIVVPPYALRQ
jgi:hypothetical protein